MTIGVSNSYETANPSIPIGFQALSTFTMVSSSANVDITLPPMVTYQVEVLDESGNPVPNVEVYPSQNSEWIDICPSSPIVAQGTNTCFLEYIGSDNFGVKVSTNTNGHAAITFFQLSGKNVQISARTNIRGIVGEVNLGASSNLTLTMPPIISVSGRVLSPSGLPVPRISLFWSNIYGVVRQSTNDDGSFTFFNVIDPRCRQRRCANPRSHTGRHQSVDGFKPESIHRQHRHLPVSCGEHHCLSAGRRWKSPPKCQRQAMQPLLHPEPHCH